MTLRLSSIYDIAGTNALLDAAGITDTNSDGWREYNGQTLHYVATCPNGWSDWQAAIEIVAAAGPAIGIDITTNYPEWPDYQTIVTNWPLPTTGFEVHATPPGETFTLHIEGYSYQVQTHQGLTVVRFIPV